MPMSPTENTLKRLRSDGFIADIVEKWNSFSRTRQDLFGFVDILAVGNGRTVAIQCTSYTNISARVRKIRDTRDKELQACLRAGWEVQVWGWHKVKNRWQCRVVDMRYS